ncbi:unnamed protein product [Cuscuta campestris]|uniref:GTPase HflX N-terminal domain-containing protein n=1 Tax=Cuscuta campestris TaxID=132261 RepID=A0A484NAU3_9ASTE|nr:unnamed protein product [Cuscuta campestris]
MTLASLMLVMPCHISSQPKLPCVASPFHSVFRSIAFEDGIGVLSPDDSFPVRNPVIKAGSEDEVAGHLQGFNVDDASVEAEENAQRPTVKRTGEGFEEKAYLVGVACKSSRDDSFDIEESLKELAQLADTAGLVVVGSTFQKLSTPNPRTYIGSGKVAEVKSAIRAFGVETAGIEEAKTEEIMKLQSALEEIQLHLQETKDLLMREHKKAKEAARIEEAQTKELVKLQSTSEEIRFQFKEANEMLMREREKAKENAELVEAKTEEHRKSAEIGEAKTEEHVKLQTDLEEMRLQLQETKELLMREQRKAKETAEIREAKTEENVKLLSALEEMRLQLQETKDLLVREQDRTKETTEIEESKTEEQLKLQFTLEETRLQFQETKELLMREQEKAEEIEDMEQAKTEENVRLRAALEEM